MSIYGTTQILIGDVRERLRTLAPGSVHCAVTSPPYWGLRDYGVDGQIGLEATPAEFVATMVDVFREVRRVLRDDGTLWLNLGDSYFGGGRGGNPDDSPHRKQATNAGSLVEPPRWAQMDCDLKPKDLCMMPWRVFLALQADGWYVRSIIAWAKKSPMPESVTDRPTSSWEPIALLSKSERYFYDAEAVKEPLADETVIKIKSCMVRPPGETQYKQNSAVAHMHMGVGSTVSPNAAWRDEEKLFRMMSGRNLRNVWHLGPEPFAEAHFATFPSEIPRRAIKAGTSEKGCCPECGAPWRRLVERFRNGRDWNRNNRAGGDRLKVGASATDAMPHDYRPPRTKGWEPTCKCGRVDVVQALVLDPFLGSGTTAMVANQLGRDAIGCELNPEYAAMAERRIAEGLRPHTARRDTVTAGLFTEDET